MLAISLRRRVEREATHERDEQAIWSFVNNALDVTLEVMMCDVTLMSIQAMVVLAWFYLGTRNPQPAFMFSASALRLCHAIGLHEKAVNDQNIPETERYLYWTAVILETHVTFRTGRPTACSYESIHNSLRNVLDQEDSSEDSSSSNHRLGCYLKGAFELSVFKLKITQHLYGDGAIHKTRSEIVSVAASLMDELQHWKAIAHLELDANISYKATDSLKTTSSEILNMVWLDCLIRSGFRVWHNSISQSTAQDVSSAGEADQRRVRKVVVEAARELCISIGRITPLPDSSLCWLVKNISSCPPTIYILVLTAVDG